MFNVIFSTTTFNGNISSVNVAFETAKEADNAIILFMESSSSNFYRDVVRLYREVFEFEIEWCSQGKLPQTDVSYGYDQESAVSNFMNGRTRNIHINNVVQLNKTLS